MHDFFIQCQNIFPLEINVSPAFSIWCDSYNLFISSSAFSLGHPGSRCSAAMIIVYTAPNNCYLYSTYSHCTLLQRPPYHRRLQNPKERKHVLYKIFLWKQAAAIVTVIVLHTASVDPPSKSTGIINVRVRLVLSNPCVLLRKTNEWCTDGASLVELSKETRRW